MTDEGNPRWEARFRAPSVIMPDWSPMAPDRIVYGSTESGVYQVHCWDLASGTKRQVTDHPVGVVDGAPTLGGEGVLYWQRFGVGEEGEKRGRMVLQSVAHRKVLPDGDLPKSKVRRRAYAGKQQEMR